MLPEPKDDLERGTQIIERVRSLATVGKFLWPIPDKGLKKRMPRIKARTLVVVGEQDKGRARVIWQRVRQSNRGCVRAFDGGRRAHDAAQPEEFTGVVRGFLQH